MTDIRAIDGERRKGVPRRFQIVPFDKLVVGTERSYLIKGLMPRVGLAVIWGPPKCGKSFWTFDATLHVAYGWEYRGRRVVQGPVVYCAFEGAEGYKKRAEAFRCQHFVNGDSPPVRFFLMPARVDLIKDHAALANSVAEALGELAPVVIVLDTLNRSLIGSESSDQDMSAYVSAADALREGFNCLVIIVHHCGIDGSRPRGHTSLAGAVETQIAVTRDRTNNVIACEVEYMKDGAEGEKVISRLEVVEVGVDADGDPITSCAVEPVEGDEERIATSRPEKMTKAARVALRALQEALTENGEPAPAATANQVPQGVTVTTVEQWRTYAYQRGISTSDNPRARQKAFQRGSEHLIGAGSVIVWEPYVWLPR